jgi:HEAT repeat protein
MSLDARIAGHLKGFNDSREGVRLFTVRRAASYGAEVAPSLIELLKDEKGYTQECAATALREIGQPAIPYLLDALKDPDRAIRWQAAMVLSAMGETAHTAVRDSQRCIRLPEDTAAN